MQEALDQLVADGAGGGRRRTTIVIAHRLSTVQKADKIVVMERGRIVEVPRPCARIEAAPFFRFVLSGNSRERFGAPPKLLFGPWRAAALVPAQLSLMPATLAANLSCRLQSMPTRFLRFGGCLADRDARGAHCAARRDLPEAGSGASRRALEQRGAGHESPWLGGGSWLPLPVWKGAGRGT